MYQYFSSFDRRLDKTLHFYPYSGTYFQKEKKIVPFDKFPLTNERTCIFSTTTMSQDRENVISDVSRDSSEINGQSSTTTQHQQSLQLIKLNFFHNPLNDNNIYHITCDRIQANSSDARDYDHAFFYSCLTDSTASFHIKCRLLTYSQIVDLLNKETCEVEILNNSSRNESSLLSLHQKLNLETSLNQKLDLYFLQCHLLENYGFCSIVVDNQNNNNSST
ncbi:unnamed protein product [Rhizophagus irregularis]|uniref:Uncharacterized protein n=4 Tax=Rhizophagus irregularis TaxID=588596 RepID=A0A916E9Z6_9GLOM|nr:unnamed protein product [Rhizophagus irregularis]